VCTRCVPASLLVMAVLPLGDPAFCSSLAGVGGDVPCSRASSHPGRMRVVAADARSCPPLFRR
jgi:hypothetical protein